MRSVPVISCIILMVLFFFDSCSQKLPPVSAAVTEKNEQTGGSSMATPPCIIYRTKADYSRNVPVLLSDDKSQIVSYPDISDIRKQGLSVYPAQLAGGFLLDNRGIGPNVAFLRITYEEYVIMEKTPQASELFQMILDADPLVDMYRCGNRYQYEAMVDELNGMIRNGSFSAFKKLK